MKGVRMLLTKFYPRYQKEKAEILKQLQNSSPVISNLTEIITRTVELSTKLATLGHSSPVAVKEGIQKLVFPEGIYYNKKLAAYRTPNVNS